MYRGISSPRLGHGVGVEIDLDAQFVFTGFYYHAPSGLNLALYRAYDYATGRWLSRDPSKDAELLRDGPNVYSYVANDPFNRVDPDGRGSLEALGRILNGSRPLQQRLVNLLQLGGASNRQANNVVCAANRAVTEAAIAACDAGNQIPGASPNMPETPAGWLTLVAEVVNGEDGNGVASKHSTFTSISCGGTPNEEAEI